MADDCSRLWHLTDTDLLTHFALTYPQSKTWTISQPTSGMLTSAMQALQKKRPEKQLWAQRESGKLATGTSGWNTAPSITSPSPSRRLRIQFLTSKSTPSESAAATYPPAVNPWELAQYRQPFWPPERKSRGWLTPTHAIDKGLPHSTVDWQTFYV